jgi:hypothetical protein
MHNTYNTIYIKVEYKVVIQPECIFKSFVNEIECRAFTFSSTMKSRKEIMREHSILDNRLNHMM